MGPRNDVDPMKARSELSSKGVDKDLEEENER
jgi:hypothetical protein